MKKRAKMEKDRQSRLQVKGAKIWRVVKWREGNWKKGGQKG